MTRLLMITAALASLAAFCPAAVQDDAQVASRRAALKTAGAWANDGFKIRDSHWSGTLAGGESRLIRVNLHAGNCYWFIVGTAGEGGKPSLSIFDESGSPVPSERYHDETSTAAGFVPESSGSYFVKIHASKDRPSAFCLIYSYK